MISGLPAVLLSLFFFYLLGLPGKWHLQTIPEEEISVEDRLARLRTASKENSLSSCCSSSSKIRSMKEIVGTSANLVDEPTWRCHQNPFIGDLGIQEPVILGEPQILTVNQRLARYRLLITDLGSLLQLQTSLNHFYLGLELMSESLVMDLST